MATLPNLHSTAFDSRTDRLRGGQRVMALITCASLAMCFTCCTLEHRHDERELASVEQYEYVMNDLRSERITLDFDDAPLSEVFEAIQQRVKLHILIEWRSLEIVGIVHDQPITVQLKNVTVAEALDAVIRSADDGEGVLGYELMPAIVVARRELLPIRSSDVRTTEYNDEGADYAVINRITPTPSRTGESRVYIPKDLHDSLRELNRMLHPRMIEEIKSDPEEFLSGYHFGLGLWIRNNWGLWSGSRLANYFEELGVSHPDDMSGIILRSYWRHLNRQDIRLQEQIEFYQNYWKTLSEQNELLNSEEKHEIEGEDILLEE